MRLLLATLALLWSSPSPGVGFARGTLRIDVRDAKGKPIEALVQVRAADGTNRKVERAGDIYVANGLVPGDYALVVESGKAEWLGARQVTVRERRTASVVAVLLESAGKKARAPGTMSGSETRCEDLPGTTLQVLAFSHDLPAAGRLDVRAASGKQKGKLLCVGAIAGGTGEVRLTPGDYSLVATFAGGGAPALFFRYFEDRTPPPIVLRYPPDPPAK